MRAGVDGEVGGVELGPVAVLDEALDAGAEVGEGCGIVHVKGDGQRWVNIFGVERLLLCTGLSVRLRLNPCWKKVNLEGYE